MGLPAKIWLSLADQQDDICSAGVILETSLYTNHMLQLGSRVGCLVDLCVVQCSSSGWSFQAVQGLSLVWYWCGLHPSTGRFLWMGLLVSTIPVWNWLSCFIHCLVVWTPQIGTFTKRYSQHLAYRISSHCQWRCCRIQTVAPACVWAWFYFS